MATFNSKLLVYQRVAAIFDLGSFTLDSLVTPGSSTDVRVDTLNQASTTSQLGFRFPQGF